ncbi:MAG TPA: ornithine cyclodeaminase family protein [Chloroflexota bacterium]|jgi:ornithine cyclodeaminase/alanine dehydrogenase-like protein (mu-crystallin family)
MFLDDEAVRRLLRMEDVIAAMAPALAEFSSGNVVQPVRSVVAVAEHGGFLGVMPAYAGSLGVKLVTFYPGNTGIPTHLATIMLFKPETGEPLVTMDGTLITEMRTAAASAVATGCLAREDASVLAILGSGVQARSHLEALRLVRDFDEVRVWSPRGAPAFARAHHVRAMQTAEETVRGADIVVTVTSSETPVLEGAWLSPGTHINAVGATRPTWRELDDTAVQRARLYVDSREAGESESGDVRAGTIVAELGEVVLDPTLGRQSPDEITLFKSVGIAVEDVVTAKIVYDRAIRELSNDGV